MQKSHLYYTDIYFIYFHLQVFDYQNIEISNKIKKVNRNIKRKLIKIKI